MRKLFITPSVLLLFVVCTNCSNDQRALQRLLLQEAAAVNMATPIMLNHYLRFDGASVTSDNRFQFHYTVLHTVNPDSLVESTLPEFTQLARIAYLTSPEMAVFRDNNVVIDWHFDDESGKTIRTVTINPNDFN